MLLYTFHQKCYLPCASLAFFAYSIDHTLLIVGHWAGSVACALLMSCHLRGEAESLRLLETSFKQTWNFVQVLYETHVKRIKTWKSIAVMLIKVKLSAKEVFFQPSSCDSVLLCWKVLCGFDDNVYFLLFLYCWRELSRFDRLKVKGQGCWTSDVFPLLC